MTYYCGFFANESFEFSDWVWSIRINDEISVSCVHLNLQHHFLVTIIDGHIRFSKFWRCCLVGSKVGRAFGTPAVRGYVVFMPSLIIAQCQSRTCWGNIARLEIQGIMIVNHKLCDCVLWYYLQYCICKSTVVAQDGFADTSQGAVHLRAPVNSTFPKFFPHYLKLGLFIWYNYIQYIITTGGYN